MILSRSSSARNGITLFEVVVALVIFVVTLPALNALLQIGTERAEEAQIITLASLQCRSKLAEVAAGALPMESADWAPLEDPNWSWRIDASDASGVSGMKTIQVWVKLEVARRNYQTTLIQMVLDPAIRGSTQDRGLMDSSSMTNMSTTEPSTSGSK